MTHTASVDMHGFVDLEVVFDYTRTPDIPAVTHKLPEDCYPAEYGEIEFTQFDIYSGGSEKVNYYMSQLSLENIQETLEERIRNGEFDEESE